LIGFVSKKANHCSAGVEPGAGATGGDETAGGDVTVVSATQAGVVRRHQANAMMLLLMKKYAISTGGEGGCAADS